MWRKPVLTHASIVCGGMLASVSDEFGEKNLVNVAVFALPTRWGHG